MIRRLSPLALVLMAAYGPAHALPENNQIELERCDLQLPGTTITAPAQCGWLDVPENPAEPEGRTIRLHVAVSPARGRSPAPDPLFFFAGGPGQAASETWPILRGTLSDINRERDIVLVDQRGTGQSAKLSCELPDEESLDTALDLEFLRQWTAECQASLDADTRFYTTSISAMDFDQVRAAMGYEKINLMGVSYGTRAAQVYLRMYPEQVRSVILDSVVPMQLHLGQEHSVSLQQALHGVLDDCAADADCAERFPNLKSRLAALTTSLREQPRSISIVHPVTGQHEEIDMNVDTLAMAVRMLAYQSQTQGMLPLLLDEATREPGDGPEPLARLAAQAIMVMDGLTDQISRGLELSVMCAEDYPGMQNDPAAAETLLGTTMFEAIQVQCEAWTRGEVPADFHQPVVSDVPVLLLSGERDPVTPPRYADQAAETFSNSMHLVANGQGHSVTSQACFRDVATEFVAEGSVDDLDTECVASIQAAPFFTTLLGPEP